MSDAIETLFILIAGTFTSDQAFRLGDLARIARASDLFRKIVKPGIRPLSETEELNFLRQALESQRWRTLETAAGRAFRIFTYREKDGRRWVIKFTGKVIGQ